MNPFGVAFSLIRRSDLIQVDHDANVIDGGPVRLLNIAAFMIHGAVHKARPNVICAAHSHSIYGRSFCTLGKSIDMITQDSCAFHNVHHRDTKTYQAALADCGPRTSLSTHHSMVLCLQTKKEWK